MDPSSIVERLWPGAGAVVAPLGGGITNHNFRVDVSGESFVLRVMGTNTGLLGIDRSVEHDATRAAAAIGVGPQVVCFDDEEAILVTRFIDGRPVPPEEMREPQNVRRAADALRAFHEGPRIPGRFDSFRIVEEYARTAVERGVALPAAYEWAREQAGAIERARGTQPERPCHNDLLNANFLDDGTRLRIVDWEYAGMGDVFFDLANFSINHELGEDENGELLAAYFGEATEADLASLRLMRFMSDFREAMWGVVQQAISELDFDFVAYADEHFERLRRTAADPDFALAVQIAEAQPPSR